MCYCFYDLAELLHYPWHTQEWILVIFIIGWFFVAKLTVLIYLKFGKVLPVIFNKSNCSFLLWMMYYSLLIIAVSNLVCNYIHGVSLILLYFKSIITFIALIIDYRETMEAISKYRESE